MRERDARCDAGYGGGDRGDERTTTRDFELIIDTCRGGACIQKCITDSLARKGDSQLTREREMEKRRGMIRGIRELSRFPVVTRPYRISSRCRARAPAFVTACCGIELSSCEP